MLLKNRFVNLLQHLELLLLKMLNQHLKYCFVNFASLKRSSRQLLI